jgi:hypothetical protein
MIALSPNIAKISFTFGNSNVFLHANFPSANTTTYIYFAIFCLAPVLRLDSPALEDVRSFRDDL